MATRDDGIASVKVILHASPPPLNFFSLLLVGLTHAISLVHLRPHHPAQHPPSPRDLDARLTKRGSSCYGDNHGAISIKEIELTSPHEQMAHSTNIVAARREPTAGRRGHRAILDIG